VADKKEKEQEEVAPEIITVKAGKKAGNRVALYEKDNAHRQAGAKDGEVWVSHDVVVRVARTPLVEDKLRSKELVETTDKPTEAKREAK
jgi:hypothetical protein